MTEYRDYNPRYPLLSRSKEPHNPEPTGYERAPVEEEYPAAYEPTQEYTPKEEPPKKKRTGLIVGIIVGIILLILIGVAIYYFFLRKKTTTTAGNGTTTSPTLGTLNQACSSTNPCAPIFTCDTTTNTCKGNLNGPCLVNTDCEQSPFTQVCTGTGGQGGQ